MKKTKVTLLLIIALVGIISIGCSTKTPEKIEGKLNVVATTTHLADVVRVVGGENVVLHGIMGPGVDPHEYTPTPSDVDRIASADVLIYHGLNFEGKMNNVFKNMQSSNVKTFAVAESVKKELLIDGEDEDEEFDPHVWFDVTLWKQVVNAARDALIESDPENKEIYMNNAETYNRDLDDLDDYIKERVQEIPEQQRVLITAHDAFRYFGNRYGFEVKGLQGISTATEVGVADIQELSSFIADRKIKSIFIESSVPVRNIEALKDAVISKSFQVNIGGELYSDALDSKDSTSGTYIGMYKYNINTIVNALK